MLPDTDLRNKYGWCLLLVVVLGFLYMWKLGSHGLMDPDEGRYSEIPREMLESGDFVTPRLNGVKYFEKPVLYYWLTAGAFKAFGYSEFATRFWPAVSGIAGAAVAYALAARRGVRPAFIAGLITGTSFLWYAIAHISLTDMVLTANLCAAIYLLYLGVTGKRGYLIPAYGFMALAVLTKGLIGILLPGMVGVSWALLTRRYRLLYRFLSIPGIVLFALICVPWFVAVGSRNPEFYWFFFIHEHFLRYATDIANRQQGVWFFPALLIIGVIPWTGTVWRGVYDSIKGLRGMGSDIASRTSCEAPASDREYDLFLLLWFAVITVFFSVSKSQLAPYILPVFPPLAAMAGMSLDRIISRKDRRGFLWSMAFNAGFTLLLATALFVYPRMQDRVPLELVMQSAYVIATALICTALLPVVLMKNLKTATAVLCVGAVVSGFTLKDAFGIMGQVRSIRVIAQMAAPHVRPDTIVADFRDYDQGLPFYLGRTVYYVNDPNPEGRQWGELSFGWSLEKPSWFATPEEIAKIWNSGAHVIMVCEQENLKDVEAKFGMKYRILGSDPLYYGKTIITNEGIGADR